MLAVPKLNRWFCSPIGLHRISFVRASEESFKTGVFDALEKSPRRTDPSASRPAKARPAPPPHHASPRPDPPVICLGFGFDKSILSFVNPSANIRITTSLSMEDPANLQYFIPNIENRIPKNFRFLIFVKDRFKFFMSEK